MNKEDNQNINKVLDFAQRRPAVLNSRSLSFSSPKSRKKILRIDFSISREKSFSLVVAIFFHSQQRKEKFLPFSGF